MAEQEIEEKQTNKKQGKQYIGCVGNSFSIGYNFFFFPPQKRQLEPSCLSTVLFLYIALKHVTFHLGFVRFRSSICFKFLDLSEWYCRKSILALVDGQPWDMYKPLTKSCEIKFLTFKDDDPGEVNKAYWRSCAMMMGCVIERAFKDEYVVSLVRAPEVPVIAGAFCYDVVLDKRLDEWMPTKENLHSFTKDARALIYKDLPFETLEVEAKVALEIFQHNKYKLDFIEEKASQNPERIVKLHRFGDFIDVSEGPLIPRTSICFQYEVSAVHNLQTQSSLVRRFQGLSLPVHLRVSRVNISGLPLGMGVGVILVLVFIPI
uniref:Large ribosomal subunit protein mL39 n=1 Tax=Sus scrofa TaxID=9823 RepID=A0A8D1ABK0_PIG